MCIDCSGYLNYYFMIRIFQSYVQKMHKYLKIYILLYRGNSVIFYHRINMIIHINYIIGNINYYLGIFNSLKPAFDVLFSHIRIGK